jgi:hypothetical protein
VEHDVATIRVEQCTENVHRSQEFDETLVGLFHYIPNFSYFCFNNQFLRKRVNMDRLTKDLSLSPIITNFFTEDNKKMSSVELHINSFTLVTTKL